MFPDIKKAIEYHEWLKPEPVKGPPVDPSEMAKVVEPVKMFDDLFMVGCKAHAIYILKTSEGLILFDSTSETDAYEKFLKPGLEKLGLDNEKVQALFLTHGHYDHYLGAEGIRKNTGCEIGISEADASYMVWSYENRSADGGFKGGMVPKISFLIRDNEEFRFGSHRIKAFLGGGHTPGCMNFSFEVHEGEETHRVMMCGGFIVFGPGAYMDFNGVYPYGVQWSVEQAMNYAASSVKMWEYVKEMRCDVFLNPHPFACGFFECAAANAERKQGDKNGFVVGINGVRKYIADRFRTAIETACKVTDIEKEYTE